MSIVRPSRSGSSYSGAPSDAHFSRLPGALKPLLFDLVENHFVRQDEIATPAEVPRLACRITQQA